MTMKALSTPITNASLAQHRPLRRIGPPAREWLYGGSAKRTAALATAAGVAVFGAGFLMGNTLLRRKLPRTAIAITDVFSGVLASTLVFDALRYARRRRNALLGRDAIIQEMNHHVRNALQTIAFTTHASPDHNLEPVIQSAIERIQWALREVLPQESWR
jgi:hypothetical protein